MVTRLLWIALLMMTLSATAAWAAETVAPSQEEPAILLSRELFLASGTKADSQAASDTAAKDTAADAPAEKGAPVPKENDESATVFADPDPEAVAAEDSAAAPEDGDAAVEAKDEGEVPAAGDGEAVEVAEEEVEETKVAETEEAEAPEKEVVFDGKPTFPTTDGMLAIGTPVPELPQTLNAWANGETASFAELRGKTVLLYFLDAGCSQCDAFSTHLERLLIQYEGKFSAIGVSTDSKRKLDRFHKEKDWLPIYHDAGGSVTHQYFGKVNKLPYVAVIDGMGTLFWFGRGKFQKQVTKEVERAMGLLPPPRTVGPPEGKRLALVIGVGGEAIPYARDDARAAANAYRRAGFDTVDLLLDAAGTDAREQPTFGVIASRLDAFLADATPQDQVVVHLIGAVKQWEKMGSKDIVFQPLSGKPVSLSKLHGVLAGKKLAHRLFVIDAPEIESIKAHQPAEKDKQFLEVLSDKSPGTPILISVSYSDRNYPVPRQKAVPGGEGSEKESLFGSLLIQALDGPADLNRDGRIVPDELYRFVRDGMSEWSRRSAILQSPTFLNEDAAMSNPVAFSVPGAVTPLPAKAAEDADPDADSETVVEEVDTEVVVEADAPAEGDEPDADNPTDKPANKPADDDDPPAEEDEK